MEHALIKQGMRLRDAYSGRLHWRDVFIVCRFADPGTPLARVIDPEGGTWTLDQAMAAQVIDNGISLSWMIHRLAGGHAERPKPIKRPWKQEGEVTETEKVTGEVMTATEMDDWLGSVIAGSLMEAADGGQLLEPEESPQLA